MACMTDTGHLSESAKKLLKSIEKDNLTAQEISKKVGLPLFKVRSSLREMEELDLVVKDGDKFKMAPRAKEYFG
ncbi:hypothetical protein [Fervidibacillus halotolerans]|uniref:Uncharacterized protein n=1 Tax=Fervidibacillus halotolerans TaxID=2980027 RepID=A0A9E8RXL0_9BACI|nr:hypothetical protein [Fervidibacillus halotolerans]WAA11881.1 hypothetical protein OE105_09830 [Fervidibacillus halotolerans]